MTHICGIELNVSDGCSLPVRECVVITLCRRTVNVLNVSDGCSLPVRRCVVITLCRRTVNVLNVSDGCSLPVRGCVVITLHLGRCPSSSRGRYGRHPLYHDSAAGHGDACTAHAPHRWWVTMTFSCRNIVISLHILLLIFGVVWYCIIKWHITIKRQGMCRYSYIYV